MSRILFPWLLNSKYNKSQRGYNSSWYDTVVWCDISWNLSPPALQLRHCSSNTGLSKANLCLKYCIPAETSVQNILLPSIYPAQFLRYLLKCHLLGEAWLTTVSNAPSLDTPLSILTLCSRSHCSLSLFTPSLNRIIHLCLGHVTLPCHHCGLSVPTPCTPSDRGLVHVAWFHQ